MTKNKNINNLVDDYDNVNPIDEKSTLCIKNKRPTNYRYNKDFPEFPYCVCNLTCVYKEYQNGNQLCTYFNKNKVK